MYLTDTPRTNEAITVIFDRDGCLGEHNAPESLVVLARKLERENTALRLAKGDMVTHAEIRDAARRVQQLQDTWRSFANVSALPNSATPSDRRIPTVANGRDEGRAGSAPSKPLQP